MAKQRALGDRQHDPSLLDELTDNIFKMTITYRESVNVVLLRDRET